MTTHLIIPDGHAHYQYSNDRFDYLGSFIMDRRPDVIINLGDLADMPSLSTHGEGLSFEGRRLREDCDAAHDALERTFNPMRKYNKRRKKNKEKQYKPHCVITMGNHEYRINRHCESHPAMSGWLDTSILKYEDYFDEVIPFGQPYLRDNISYCHYFATGVSGRPISGENIGRALCTKLHASCVQGHSHIFDHAERVTAVGQRIFGLSAGCYVHPDYVEDWCRTTVIYWWRGVVLLHDLDGEGYYDRAEYITMRWLERNYG